jgi:hypothetical protein
LVTATVDFSSPRDRTQRAWSIPVSSRETASRPQRWRLARVEAAQADKSSLPLPTPRLFRVRQPFRPLKFPSALTAEAKWANIRLQCGVASGVGSCVRVPITLQPAVPHRARRRDAAWAARRQSERTTSLRVESGLLRIVVEYVDRRGSH